MYIYSIECISHFFNIEDTKEEDNVNLLNIMFTIHKNMFRARGVYTVANATL